MNSKNAIKVLDTLRFLSCDADGDVTMVIKSKELGQIYRSVKSIMPPHLYCFYCAIIQYGKLRGRMLLTRAQREIRFLSMPLPRPVIPNLYQRDIND